MQVGRLNKRVQILRATEKGTRATGEPTLEWTSVATVWASIEDLRGQELEAARQIESRAQTKIVVRYWPGLSARHRLKWEGLDRTEFFEIASVEDRRHGGREMILTCVRIEGAL